MILVISELCFLVEILTIQVSPIIIKCAQMIQLSMMLYT